MKFFQLDRQFFSDRLFRPNHRSLLNGSDFADLLSRDDWICISQIFFVTSQATSPSLPTDRQPPNGLEAVSQEGGGRRRRRGRRGRGQQRGSHHHDRQAAGDANGEKEEAQVVGMSPSGLGTCAFGGFLA